MATIDTLNTDRLLAEQAVATVERERKRLYRGDGQPLYSPEEMKERNETLLAPALAKLADLDTALAEADSEAGRLESIANGSDPLGALSVDELSKAASWQVLLSDEIAKMPLVSLAERLQAAALSTDKPHKTVLHRLASQRYSQTRELMTMGADLSGPGRDPVRERNAVGTIHTLLETIGGQIADPRATKAGKDAAELRTQAQELRRWATKTRNDVTGATERYRAQQEQWARAQF